MTWQADALCTEHPEVNFFPEQGESLDAARAVCEHCAVQAECLDLALSLGTLGKYGVWAGTSAKERRLLRRSLLEATPEGLLRAS